MKDNTFKVIATYKNNTSKEAAVTSETPEKAIEKAIVGNHLPLNFIDSLPIFWRNYNPIEKTLHIINSEQHYEIQLINNSTFEKSIFSNNDLSNCDITSVTVEEG